jgi:hypothetical protein
MVYLLASADVFIFFLLSLAQHRSQKYRRDFGLKVSPFLRTPSSYLYFPSSASTSTQVLLLAIFLPNPIASVHPVTLVLHQPFSSQLIGGMIPSL